MQIASVCRTERVLFLKWPRAASTNSPVALEPMLVVHVPAYVLLPLPLRCTHRQMTATQRNDPINTSSAQNHNHTVVRSLASAPSWNQAESAEPNRNENRLLGNMFAGQCIDSVLLSSPRITESLHSFASECSALFADADGKRAGEAERANARAHTIQALFRPIKTKINNCVRFIFQAFRDREAATECVSSRNRFQCQPQLIFHRGRAAEYAEGKNCICISDGFCCVCLLYQYWKTSPCTFTVNYLLSGMR